MTFDNPFAFVIFGMWSGLIWALSLSVVFSYIGLSKRFASESLDG